MNGTRKPVFLVIGAGAGIGATTAARFAAGGYHAVLARRSDKEGLERAVSRIEQAGGSASGILLMRARMARLKRWSTR
ncbi:SDR family NAD(P)-dependent oxidoreductase [Qipengyuania nanhaisediminis]|uniref:SDR family NAD(P)-dependent oxidoreductase n=1 Tax=Qipengyuania nanhaisediminis TaxID=604088 RepID=UPI0038B3F5B5